MRSRFPKWVVASAAVAVLLVACGDDDQPGTSTDEAGAQPGDGSTEVGEEPCPGTAGCTPRPPSAGDDVTIGMLSTGDTNDNGYYESFVSAARDHAASKGWEAIVVDRVAPSEAADQARNLCRQGVSFVGLADADLVDAIPVAEEEVCEGVVFYTNSNEDLTPYVFNTTDDVDESQVTAGYATGLVMRELGVTSAAFIGGPELDFVTQAFDAWTAGIRQVLPEATTSKTFTGDFDDAALGQEAAKAQIAAGAGVLYPYLGGATDAVAMAGLDAGARSVAPGTDRCDDPAFVVSSLFPPGEYFVQAIEAWEAGEVRMGESFSNRVGVQEFPSAEVCDNGTVEGAADLQAEVEAFMERIGSGEVVARDLVDG